MLPKLLPPGVQHKPPPRNLDTPPYVTAEPEVQYRKFSLPSTSPKDPSSSTLRFLILATDGLWDELSSNDAVALVAAHITGQRGSIDKTQLLKQLPLREDHTQKTSAPLPHTARSRNVKWAFRDEELGMHLIRNACGGDNEIAIRQTLSIPAPYSRRFRDDITAAVITFDSAAVQPSKVSAKL